MITRSNLAEQLREYQIRSKHDWASVSFFSSTSNLPSSRVDVVIFVIWELVILAFLVFSAVSLYFRHMRLAFILVCFTMLLLLCMKITKQVRLARKKKRRMLLPLSM
ncbi:NADH-ubiquinone oxidoreductase chain [Fagus crenata]